MQHRNPIWLIFLTLLVAITLGYTGKALYRWYGYAILDASTTATAVEWSVKELSDDEFVPFGKYTYHVNGMEYKGEGALSKELYRNEWAVQEDLPKLAKKSWKVWYRASYPDQSALQKNFPFKECLSAGVLIALSLYFLGLGYYVFRLKTKDVA